MPARGCSRAALELMSWSRAFDEPIPVPRGRQLVTLRDAGDYIAKLPKAKYLTAEWQAAMFALMLVVDLNGPTMMARIGIMRALNRHVERVFDPSRKEKALGTQEAGSGSMTQPGNVRFDAFRTRARRRAMSEMCQYRTHAKQSPRYSITSSARTSNDGGTVRPSSLAVFMLITSSNLVGCSTGRSAGLVPLRILST